MVINGSINRRTGWAFYSDSLATPSIALSVVRAQVTIDGLGASNNTTYLPRSIRGNSQLWASDKITPIVAGDSYICRFDYTLSAVAGAATLKLEVDTGGGGSVIDSTYYVPITGIGKASFTFPIFTLANFIAGGGKLYLTTDAGTATLTTRDILISRVHSDL
jgi:hypothetical protein